VRGLDAFGAGKVGNRECDLQDAIEERAADARTVALDLHGTAATLVFRIAKVATRTGVHRCHQHEGARERDFAGASGDGDIAVFERLAKHFERGAFELRQT
jgi:hypothetical protein